MDVLDAPQPTPSPAKSHYLILDGLRGVAAIVVVFFHLFESNPNGNRFTQSVNHGYLAVDFFFLLSGFVIAYAYDSRWGRMSQVEFYKRRLVRLQPMVIMGMTLGAALFYLQASHTFPSIAITPIWKVLLLMVLGDIMCPLFLPFRVHGYQEMYPLDGPAWSLFFEYIANVLYAIGIRKLSNRALGILLIFAAAFLIQTAVFGGRGDLIGGWSLAPSQLRFGFARLLFPFFAGVLLMRSGFRISVKGAFWICSALLITLLVLPRFGSSQHLWANGLYDASCDLIAFPIIVAMGAGEVITEGHAVRLSRFLGNLSYPLYITHHLLISVYAAWVVDRKVTTAREAVYGIFVLIASIALAYACLKLYDEPVRRWLSSRFLRRPSQSSLDVSRPVSSPG